MSRDFFQQRATVVARLCVVCTLNLRQKLRIVVKGALFQGASVGAGPQDDLRG